MSFLNLKETKRGHPNKKKFCMRHLEVCNCKDNL